MNRGPETFHFHGPNAYVSATESEAQLIIDHFKNWLPVTTTVYRQMLEQAAAKEAQDRKNRIQREKDEEERFIRVNSNLRF